jgi:outer membrane protein assembly factor BamB
MRRESFLTVMCAGFMLSIAVVPFAGALPDPVKEWTAEPGPDYAATPVVYPSEAPDSLIFATGGYVARVSGTGEILFQVALGPERGRGSMFWPSVADVNGDGKEDIVAGRNDGIIYALDADNGDVMWECRLPDRLTGYEWAAAADLDGDGRAEAVVTTMYGWVYAIDDDGTVLWRAKAEDYRPSAPAIADIDSDGEPEIVYGTATRYLVALNTQGEIEWTSFQPPHHLGRTTPMIADADGDGRAEVYGMSSMLSPGKGLVCLNGTDGSLRWYGLTIGKAYGGRALTRFADGATGILSCDKGGNIHAQHADGSLRWHARLSGSGLFSPPVTADIDGDGVLELVAMVRDTSTDGKGNNWYVLNADTGEILGAWNHPNRGIMGAAALDIDRDGTIEVVLCSKEGNVTAYTFGGSATSESIVFSHAGQRTFPVRVASPEIRTKKPAPSIKLTDGISDVRFGTNALNLRLPANAGDDAAVEVALKGPDSLRSTRVFRAENGKLDASWQALASGRYVLSLRLLDLASGETLGVQTLRASLKHEGALRQLTDATAARIHDIIDDAEAATLTLSKRAADIEARFSALCDAIRQSKGKTVAERAAIAKKVDDYVDFLAQSEDFAALVAAEAQAGRELKFVCWNDADPWDDDSPYDELPMEGGPPTIDVWAFGNEKESVCINILNVSPGSITLRIEPGSIGGSGSLPKVSELTSLHRVLWLPTSDGIQVADVLPRLDEGYLIDLAPGEIRQLWINLSTRDLAPGQYIFTWPVRSLDADSTTVDVTVRLDVSPARLPEESLFYTGYWSQNSFDGFSSIPDLNDHLQTFWDRVPGLPTAKVNSRGQIIEQIDWSAWDAFLDEVQQHGVIRLHHVPVPTFPEGVKASEELRLKGQRNYVKAWMTHMGEFGLGYRDFAFYVEDETGLRGTHENFMRGAKHIKEIDPKLQVYANPWGAITKDMLRDMAPVTDVWQPGMEVIEYFGTEVVDIMRADGGRRIAMYTPPGGCRALLPLGFFRSQPWLALHWGIEGGGWWVYRQADLFSTGPQGDPSYGGVNWDGRRLVWSRRWEAMRDGVEDFNAVSMLRNLANAKGDAAAKSAIDEAVGYVASECITGMPREAADYDMDFAVLMKHRAAIRAALERLSR